ncbi:restriction endonuclease S subunit [Vibrio sp. ES.051]|uniref:restriction endonuclease subunit S n=1 Tax=Vibrio sp. ES.051 TaxID=1761909 RepID=UPI000BF52373|nr:restriction endonuclease subunit S [Vibrio sp. ES.051]PFG45529.1 restriction endonuclease S subunit [Vibrio sp. ES.051]
MRKNTKPQLRFPIYDSNWAIRKIKDVAPLQRGFDLPTTNVIEGKYPVVYSNGIGRYHNEFKAKAPGIVTGRSGTIGALTYVEKDYWPHNTSLWVTDFIDCTPKFVFYLYQKIGLKRFATGSGVPTLNRNDVHDFRTHIPELNEQKKIADFLTSVDSKISQLTEKHRLLKEYKKGVVQQVFSQQIRFKDENGKAFPEWEEKRLSEMLVEYKAKSTVENEHDVLTSSRNGLIKQSDYYGEGRITDRSNVGFHIIPADYITFRSRSDDRLFFFNRNTTGCTGIISHYYPVFRMKNNQNHFFIELTRYHSSSFGKYAVGTSQVVLSYKALCSMKFSFPTTDEQQKIAQFLQSIDHKIDAVAEQIEHTKQFKKGLLQQMFV